MVNRRFVIPVLAALLSCAPAFAGSGFDIRALAADLAAQGSSSYLDVEFANVDGTSLKLDLYVPDDPRHGHDWVHFLGVQAEWWFNSTTYKR